MGFATQISEGIELRVKVIPRSSKSGILGKHDGRLKVRVNSPPVDGEANKELIKILSKSLGIAKSAIFLVAGESSRNKTLVVATDSPGEIFSRLSEI